nr:MAG TPA: 50S ribosomal subunit [Caudoviricetes sp.]
MSRITYSQVRCPACNKYVMVLKDKMYEPFVCKECGEEVQLINYADKSSSLYGGGCPSIISDRASANRRMSSEFRDSVLNPIMNQRGAVNEIRKYG